MKPDCDKCGLKGCPTVYGEGPDRADVVIIGEAPGNTEVAVGRPFVGPAGQLLNKVLESCGADRSTVYITNVCICRPIPHRAPRSAEIRACRPRLFEEIRQRKPKLIIALGACAARAVVPGFKSLTDARGTIYESDTLNTCVLATYHPAAVLRSPNLYPDLKYDVLKGFSHLKNYTQISVGQPPSVAYEEVSTLPDLAKMANRLLGGDEIVTLDVETTGDGKLLSVGQCNNAGCFVLTEELLRGNPCGVRNVLNRILSSKQMLAHNAKFDIQRLWDYGVTKASTGVDTMLMSYVLDERPGTHGLKYLAQRYLGADNYADPVKKYYNNMEECPRDLLYHYNAQDVVYTYALYHDLDKRLSAEEKHLLSSLLYPASDALARMEYTGVRVDVPYLKNLSQELPQEIDDILHQLYETAGFEFNPNSPKQLIDVLYYKLELPVPGKFSTDRKSLEMIAEVCDHPIIPLLLKYRDRKKFYSTYVASLLEKADSNDRIHASFNLIGTVTGRLSSNNPNLQNIPKGSDARKIFIATDGYTMIEGDLKQAEVRVMCWFARDEKLRETIMSGEDMHARTATLMFGKVDPELRQKAKRITFGLLYQMSAHSLASDLKISVNEASVLQRKFFEAYPAVEEWIENIKQEVLRTGMVKTPFGRTRRFELITRENQAEVLRQAVNAPIQSSASDITLSALVRLDKRIKRGELGDTRLLLTVHDSIVLETKEDPQEMAKVVKGEMESPVLDGWVPFAADIKTGKTW